MAVDLMSFPSTGGVWVPAPGAPLVEIKSDGAGGVYGRPAGNRDTSLMGEGEKAAYQISKALLFEGPEAAERLKYQTLSLYAPVTTLQTPGGVVKGSAWDTQQQEYAAMVAAKRLAEAAQSDAALMTGTYVTTPAVVPPPPPVTTGNDLPPAAPISAPATSHAVLTLGDTHAAVPDGGGLGVPGAGDGPGLDVSVGWQTLAILAVIGAALFYVLRKT